MNGEPLPPAVDGARAPTRDARGRFLPGNRAGRGNPLAAQVARLRAALVRAVGPDDIAAVVAALLARARGGDVAACRELLDRTLGKATVGLDLAPAPDAVPREALLGVLRVMRELLVLRVGPEAADALWDEVGELLGFTDADGHEESS